MIALFCRLYKTKRMQHMSCILLFCIYIPHYSNYLSIFIRYTPTQTEGHIPCLRHQQLYFSDSPVLFPALHLDSPAGTLLQLHLLWGPHRRILSDLHNFLNQIIANEYYMYSTFLPYKSAKSVVGEWNTLLSKYSFLIVEKIPCKRRYTRYSFTLFWLYTHTKLWLKHLL